MKALGCLLLASLAVACSNTTPTTPSLPGSGSTDMVVPDNADHGGRALQAHLTGAAVEPVPGDPDGEGWLSLSVNTGQGEFCYSLRVKDIDVSGARVHFHAGRMGDNDAIAQFSMVLVPTEPGFAYGTGCVENLPRKDLQSIRSHPEQYCVCVHTDRYPDGALIGQLQFNPKPY